MDNEVKVQYWRGLQAKNGWKRAPVLEFCYLIPGRAT